MDDVQTKLEPWQSAADALAEGDAALAVVSPPPPPLDTLWHADFEAPDLETQAERGRRLSDADALLSSTATEERSDVSEPVAPAAQREEVPPLDAKQARQAALAARRRRTYRIRKKSELEALREASAVLGDRLAELLGRQEQLKERLIEHGRAGRFSAGWRGVALRQLQRRIEAETLNRELRELVRQHHGVAQTLACSVRSQLSPQQLNCLPVPSESQQLQPPKAAVPLEDGDVRTVAEFLREIDATYTDAEAVLSCCQLPAETDQAYNSRRSWRQDSCSNDAFFELVETWAMPFALEDASPAMRSSLPFILAKECYPAAVPVPDPSNATSIKFDFSCADNQQQKVWYRTVLVAKVFLQQDQAIFRWRSRTVERDHAGSAGDDIVETGWGVARRGPSAVGDRHDPPGTRIALYTRFSARDGTRSERLEKYVNALFNTDNQSDMEEWYQVIESIVMNDLAALNIRQAP